MVSKEAIEHSLANQDTLIDTCVKVTCVSMNRTISQGRIRAAYAIAVGADVLQLALFPLFAEGIASPLEAGLDVAVGLILTLLLGWHYAFLPSFIVELVPMVDLVPTWVLAVLLATRRKRSAPAESNAERPAQPHPNGPAPNSGPVIDVEASVSTEAERDMRTR